MAPGGCCSSKHQRKWIAANLLASGILCGSAIFLYTNIGPLAASLNCAILKISRLSTGGGAGAAAAKSIPKDILQPVTQAVPYFDFASMAPALVTTFLHLLAAGFACCSNQTYYCSKFWVLVALPCIVLTLGWYVALLAAGVLSDRAIVLDQWQKITSVCTTAEPMMSQALSDAKAALASAESSGATGSDLTSAKAALLAGQLQLSDFNELCSCLGRVPTDLKGLIGAGLLGMAASVVSLVSISGLCCSEGCCRRPRSSRAKVSDEPDDGKGLDGEDPDADADETELVDEDR